ncbi:UNVERIFIED_CONTAM: putative pyridoxamine 5'-phosphate oxidase family protein [Acetivibrio alkalicellulosi]
MNKKMSSEELKGHVLDFLSEHKEGALATCMNNIPRSSPVQYFLGKETDIFILSAGGEKFEAISQNPNVCLLVHTDYLDYRRIKGVQIFGRAVTSLQDKNIVSEAKQCMSDAYILDKDSDKLKVIKIIPSEVVYLDSIKVGDRTKQVLSGNQVIIKEDRISALYQ